jgi:hypothetical protein
MDTDRRPDEVLKLPLDCLDRDADGKFVLVYEDFKLYRRNRRLPITDGTAAVIRDQQGTVTSRFPRRRPRQAGAAALIAAQPSR